MEHLVMEWTYINSGERSNATAQRSSELRRGKTGMSDNIGTANHQTPHAFDEDNVDDSFTRDEPPIPCMHILVIWVP